MTKKGTISTGISGALTVVFVLLLSFFSYKLYINHYFTIFDLGLGYRLSYIFSRTLSPVNWPVPYALVSAKPYTKMFYVITGGTLWIYNSPLTILIDQTVIIGLGSFAAYYITYFKTKQAGVSIGVQLIYFLYPSTYGFLTQGGNFMVFLEGLLLLNYMFYLRKNRIMFLITGILGAITNAWAPLIFVGLYALEAFNRGPPKSLRVYVSRFSERLRSKPAILRGRKAIQSLAQRSIKVNTHAYYYKIKRQFNLLFISKARSSIIILGLFCIGLFAFEVQVYSLHGLIFASRLGTGSLSTGTTQNLISYLIGGSSFDKLDFVGNQLSPFLFTPLLSIFALPVVFYFLIVVTLTNYPAYYNPVQQYPYQYAGFLFIALGDVFKKFNNKSISRKLIVVMIVASFFVFIALSPFNLANVSSGHLKSELKYSKLNFELYHEYSLVPIHTSVFIQNEMPVLMDRDQVYMEGYYNNQTVSYAVINPIPLNGLVASFGGFSLYWANHFADNPSYGILASVQGAIVFNLHYELAPTYFVPVEYNTLLMASFGEHQNLSGGIYTNNSFLLSPGSYNVTYTASSKNFSDLPNLLSLTFVNSTGAKLIQSDFTQQSFVIVGSHYELYTNFTIQDYAQLSLLLSNPLENASQGSFTLQTLQIDQIST